MPHAQAAQRYAQQAAGAIGKSKPSEEKLVERFHETYHLETSTSAGERSLSGGLHMIRILEALN